MAINGRKDPKTYFADILCLISRRSIERNSLIFIDNMTYKIRLKTPFVINSSNLSEIDHEVAQLVEIRDQEKLR